MRNNIEFYLYYNLEHVVLYFHINPYQTFDFEDEYFVLFKSFNITPM